MDEITIRFAGMQIKARGVSPVAIFIVASVSGACVTAFLALM